MVLCIEISEKTKAELDELVQVGQYKDYSQTVAIALANQLVLQRQVIRSGEVVVSKPNASDGSIITAVPSEPIPAQPEEIEGAVPTRTDHWAATKLPKIFSMLSYDAPKKISPLPDDVFALGQEVPVDRWIFGQHNKLLPAKASCRALSNLQVQWCNEPNGLLLARVSSEIASSALKLGDYLRTLDAHRGVRRDDALSIAFPFSGADAGVKARLRYASQFVASMNRQGQLTGLLIDMKLVNRVPSKQPRILLTEAGWKFSSLPNPVLDGASSDQLKRFSGEEVSFLLQHIRTTVPAEDFAYRTILFALTNGEDTPDRLDQYLKNYLPDRTDKPFTKGFLSTQRSGAISRMADLGLVERVRDGIKVTYVTTDLGTQFFNGIGVNGAKEAVNG
jgi:hypothetical protein